MYRISQNCTGCRFCVHWCPVKAIQGRKNQPHRILETCISCGACGRICAYQAVEDDWGNRQQRIPIAQWSKPVWDYSQCDLCLDCVKICPVGCIKAGDKKKVTEIGRYPVLTAPKSCLGCGFCSTTCSKGAIKMVFATSTGVTQC